MLRYLLMATLVANVSGAVIAAEQSPAETQKNFNHKYQDYLRADSQMLLPFPKLEVQEWRKIHELHPLKKVYIEPGKYYNNKIYTFTLYQIAGEDIYYLDAKGGFWGMDELFYGPISGKDMQ